MENIFLLLLNFSRAFKLQLQISRGNTGVLIDALREQLNAAGPGARLEVRGKGTKMTLRVVGAGVTTLDEGGDLNKSHVCPPFCP